MSKKKGLKMSLIKNNEFYVNTPDDLWKLVEMHQLDYSVESDNKSDIA